MRRETAKQDQRGRAYAYHSVPNVPSVSVAVARCSKRFLCRVSRSERCSWKLYISSADESLSYSARELQMSCATSSFLRVIAEPYDICHPVPPENRPAVHYECVQVQPPWRRATTEGSTNNRWKPSNARPTNAGNLPLENRNAVRVALTRQLSPVAFGAPLAA